MANKPNGKAVIVLALIGIAAFLAAIALSASLHRRVSKADLASFEETVSGALREADHRTADEELQRLEQKVDRLAADTAAIRSLLESREAGTLRPKDKEAP